MISYSIMNWCDLYQYYISKDINRHILSSIFSTLSMIFIGILTYILLLCIDWVSLLTCDDNCQNLDNYISFNVTMNYFSIFIISNLVVIFILGFIYIRSNIRKYHRLRKMDEYIVSIGLTQYDIKTMEWDNLVKCIIKSLDPAPGIDLEAGTSIINDSVTILNIESNLNKCQDAILESRQEILKLDHLVKEFIKNDIKLCFYTSFLHWLLVSIFSDAYYIKDHKEIRKRITILGILSIFFSPFSFIPIVIYYFVKHAENFHERKDYVGPRDWTQYAKVYLRKNNELDHELENRLCLASKSANIYVDQFPLPILTIIAQFLSFVSSSFLTIFLLIALYNENIVLHVEFLNRNLVFYLGIFTGLFTLSRFFIPQKKDLPYSPAKRMNEMLKHISPLDKTELANWKNNSGSQIIRSEILKLYPFKVLIFLKELVLLLLLPFVLLFSFRNQSRKFYNIIRKCTSKINNNWVVKHS